MKKLFCLLTVLTAILCGCQTSGGGNDSYQALNDRELTHLKEYVRHNMLRDYRLTDDQRQLIEEVEPILKITYEGDKAGKAYISWNIPQNLRLIAQMPFGEKLADAGEKDFNDINTRLFIYK